MRPAKVKLMKNYRLYGFPRLQTTQYQKENTDKNIKPSVFEVHILSWQPKKG